MFWWSPARTVRLALPELSGSNRAAWLRLALRNGRPVRNFGDEMSPLAWEYATGHGVRWSDPHTADVVGIGSILELALAMDTRAAIWGTGAQGKLTSAQGLQLSDLSVLALRGPLTAAALPSTGGAPQMPLGDPGLLIKEFIDGRQVAPRSGNLFLPHYRTWGSPRGRESLKAAAAQGFRIAEPNWSPIRVGTEVARSNFVASSSLHGIIFAHSLGVPAQSVTAGAGEPQFKYEDYYASLGLRPDRRPASEACTANFAQNNLERLDALGRDLAPQLAGLAERLVRSAVDA